MLTSQRLPKLLLALLPCLLNLAGSYASAASANPCASLEVASVVSRPTIANATDTTLCGVIEAEYGFDSIWPGAGSRHDDFTGGLRFGITPRLDLHWASGDYVNFDTIEGIQRGFGDTWLGVKYRLSSQAKKRPAFALYYQIKIPSAAFGLGSGEVDHSIALIASKDVRRVHFDFNVIPSFIGRAGGGFDYNTGFACASWLALPRRFTLVMEPYGYTSLNAGTPAYASLMTGVSYRVNRRFYLDTGIDTGVSHAAPHKRVYAGMTYAIGNLYQWFQLRR